MKLFRLEIQVISLEDGFSGKDVIYITEDEQIRAISRAEEFLKQVNPDMTYKILSYQEMPFSTALYGRMLISTPKDFEYKPIPLDGGSSAIIH